MWRDDVRCIRNAGVSCEISDTWQVCLCYSHTPKAQIYTNDSYKCGTQNVGTCVWGKVGHVSYLT